MFAARYFAPRYFAPRYFAEVGSTPVASTTPEIILGTHQVAREVLTELHCTPTRARTSHIARTRRTSLEQ